LYLLKVTDMFCAQFWLGIFQLCHYIDYISSIYDNPVIFLHYYQLSEQLMQQRNTVALTLPLLMIRLASRQDYIVVTIPPQIFLMISQ